MQDHTINQDWKNKLLKELPPDSNIEATKFAFDKNIYAEAYIDWVNRFSGNVRKESSWNICAVIDCHSIELKNKLAKKALNNGAEAICIHVSENEDLSTLLSGIHLDYIFAMFTFDEVPHVGQQDLINYISKNYSNSIYFGTKNFKLRYFENQFEIIEPSIKSNFGVDILENLCQQYMEMNHRNVILKLTSSFEFYQTIALLRALRILIANIDKQLGFDRQIKIWMDVLNENFESGEEGKNLIAQSYRTLSSVLGGADIVSTQNWDSENDWSRISQNIQNILKHESHLDQYSDISAGSYFFEDVTEKIVVEVFDRLCV
jgi:methylmalonyl-CoA mutase